MYFIPDLSFDTGPPSLAITINLQKSFIKFLHSKFGCEVTNCFGTSNRSLLPVETYDAVVFNSYDLLGDFTVSIFSRHVLFLEAF